MSDYKRTNHTEWDCKYHIIFIPKYRKKVLYGKLRDRLGGVFRRLAHQKESEVEEGHLRVDHVHMMLSIPPKYSVATVVGFLKGKSAIGIARNFGEAMRGFIGKNFWARGYFVSTVGRDEEVIRNYIQRQEAEDRRAKLLEAARDLWPEAQRLATGQRGRPPVRKHLVQLLEQRSLAVSDKDARYLMDQLRQESTAGQ